MSVNKNQPDPNADTSLRAKIREAWETDLKPTLKATGRQGASELAQGLKAFPDSISPVETTGTIGNPTQMQISQEFGVHGKGLDPAEKEEPGKENMTATAPEKAATKEFEPDYEP